MSNSSQVLVTGGAGFIGHFLVQELIDRGREVVVVDNLSSGQAESVPETAEFIKRDIRDGVEDLLEDIDTIFHLAAQVDVRAALEQPDTDADINITGSIRVIQDAAEAGVDNFVFFSSGGAIYDPEAQLPHTEDSPADPQSPYGLSKLTAEEYLQLLADDMDLQVLRLSNVYGPRVGRSGEGGVISIFADRLVADETLEVFGDGKQTRDFVFVDDVVRAAVQTTESDRSGIFNVSVNETTSVNEIISILKNLAAEEGLPEPEVVYKKAIPGEIRHSRLSAEKIKNQVGWSPQTDLSEGIRQIINHEQGKSS